MMRAATLQGFGIGDIVDSIGDVFHGAVGLVDDFVDGSLHVVQRALPALAAVGGFVVGGPGGAVKGFMLGKQIFDAQEAKEKGEDAQREYQRAAYLANYLASAGIDISGNDAAANELIAELQARDYNYESDESQALIEAFIVAKREQQKSTQLVMLGAGVILVGALVYYLARRRR